MFYKVSEASPDIKKVRNTSKTLNSSLLILTQLAILLFSITCTSCKMVFTRDIKSYLKEYTETAAINAQKDDDGYITNLGSDFAKYKKTDTNGNTFYCIPSDKEFRITFQLRNPQRYIFDFGTRPDFDAEKASMTVSFDSLYKDLTGADLIAPDPVLALEPKDFIKALKDSKIEPWYLIAEEKPEDTETYALFQKGDVYKLYNDNKDDCYYLTLTYSQDFLYKTEMGHNISPTISLRHPDTKTRFSDYKKLKLVSNSAPPEIFNPIVYQNKDNYVLLFNMPSQGLLGSIHRDVKTLTIHSAGDKKNPSFTYEYSIGYNINAKGEYDGTFTLTRGSKVPEKSEPIQADPTIPGTATYVSDITPIGAVFEQKGQPVYIVLDDKLSDYDNTYYFTLTDNFGLTSKVETNVRTKKLSDLYVTDKNDILLFGNEEIKQDEGSSFATINILPALRTYWFEEEGTKTIQNKYYVTQQIDGENVDVAKNFVFDETNIDENNYQNVEPYNLISPIPDDAFVKVNNNGTVTSIAPGQDTKNVINSWKTMQENTSKCSIVYEIHQGKDDTGLSLFNAVFEIQNEVSGSHPKITKVTTENGTKDKLDNIKNTLKKSGNYLPIEVPAGDIFIRVYTHKEKFADSTPKEFKMSILRTRVFVSGDGDDEKNNGSINSPFNTISHAAETLSKPGDKDNTITVTTNLTENIVIPRTDNTDDSTTDDKKPLYVRIIPTSVKKYTSSGSTPQEADKAYENCFTITANDETEPVLKVPDNATVIIEDLVLTGGDIKVGKNAKLYLNNVKITGNIFVEENGIIILGGKTIINNEITENGNVTTPRTNYVELTETAKIQLGNNDSTTPSKKYEPQKLIQLQTKDKNPTLNVILLESEDGKALKDTYNIIYTDLTDEDYNNAFKYFKLDDSHSPGYYIGYDDEKAGTETYGRGLVKIPAVYIIEPSVGGFTVELYKSDGTKKITPALTPVDKGYSNKVYEITEGTKLTYSIFRNGEDLVEHINDKGNKLSNLKLELYLEGKSIEISKSNSKLLAPELTIPTAYPEGWYSVYAYFTYDQISYCEHFIIYLKEVN